MVGLRVIGGDVVVHINALNNGLSGISQTLINSIQINTSGISFMEAQNINDSSRELVIYTHYASEPTLAWDEISHGIAADGTPMVVHNIIDANTSALLSQFSDTMTFLATGWPDIPLKDQVAGAPLRGDTDILSLPCPVTPVAKGVGKTLYSGAVSLSTTFKDAAFELWDKQRNCHYTVNFCGNPAANNGDSCSENLDTFGKTNNNIWGDGTSNNDNTAAADAHYGHAATFDFYQQVFNRKGVFNSRVHAKVKENNARWTPGESSISYGDGDGIKTGPFTTVDIAAHELTHGVTEFSTR
jgi:hypothetical protein